MDKYKISVIVPVYNTERYIEQCLDSLINQTYKDIEIILVNDASTDNTLTILKEYEKKYSNIEVINLKKNMRQGGARNIGIRHASGDYISFIDSDDWIELDTYEKLISNLLDTKVDIVSVCSYFRELSDNNTKISSDGDFNFLSKISCRLISDFEKEQLLFKCPGVCQNLYKTSLIKDNHVFFPEGLSYEDNFFVPLVFAYADSIICLKEPLYHYRENLSSTLFKSNNTQLDRIKVENLRHNAFKERGLLDKYFDGYEILSLKLHYLNTLGTIYKFFKDDFIRLSKNLKEDFYSSFPNFKKNKYYKEEISFLEKVKVDMMNISPRLLLLLFKIRDYKDGA